ncbi:acrB/AcrD/AcrF family transporter [Bacteroides sp. CAG:1060]|nr:acrB/AcrD/AcrF family transporter [Bacteroides sp. CAG:1060]
MEKHKNLILLVTAMLIALGVYGIFKINKDEFPTFELKQGLVAAVYPGASPQQVQLQVAEPLEKVLFSFQEVDRSSVKVSITDGMCYLLSDLNVPAKEKDRVWSKIKLKLNEVKATLPPGVLAVVVLDDFSSVSASLIALSSTDKSYSEMKEYADRLCEMLHRIPMLSTTKIYGDRSEEIAVTVDREKLSAYGINPTSLMLGYQTSSLQVPSGSFDTDYANSPIHITGAVSSEQEVADMIVYSDPDGNILRLKDIATIERRYSNPESYVDYNGASAIIISVEMLPDNNIVAFGEELYKTLDEFRSELPQSVSVSQITNQPKVVSDSVFSFLRDLVISIFVVILVMMMLFPMKSALIASSGVPVCTAVALAVMFIVKIDLNTVTLAALIVVLGMIVDDSIITMDGYMDHLGRGKTRSEAAKASTKELVMPMFMATSSISFMFFPMLGIITGYLGEFVQLFPWVIGISLFASLAYAVFVVPIFETRFITSPRPSSDNFFSRGQNRFFNTMQSTYDKVQAVCFRHPKLTIWSGVLAVALGFLMFSQLTVQMMPKADREYFAMEITLDSNAGLEDTRQVVDSIQSIVLSDPRVESLTAFIGDAAPRFTATYPPSTPSKNFSQLIINTRSKKATAELLPEFEAKFGNMFPNAIVRVKQMDYQSVTPIEVILEGGDFETVKPYADSIRAFMQGMDDELMWVHSSADNFVNCVEVEMDPEESVRLGVNKTMLSLSLFGAMGSQSLATLWEDGKELPVRLYSESTTRSMNYDMLGNQQVATSIPGLSVPLRQVASIKPSWEPALLERIGGEQVIVVSADMKYGRSQPVSMRKVKAFVEGLDLPEGVSFRYGGLSSMNSSVIPEIVMAFLSAVLVLFFFLLFHFKKISIAVLTIVLSTLCFFGAFFGLWIFGLDFSLTAVLGLISLMGIIVRNGIILFEHAEDLRFKEGLPVKEAAELAGKRRMRPIFLTSCTTALGVLPMVISHDNLWMPLGVVICFGTMLSVFLITLIMPVSYWQIFAKDKKK